MDNNGGMTIADVLGKVFIPSQYASNVDQYPNLRIFYSLLKKGRADDAMKCYEYFASRNLMFLTQDELRKARNRRNNKRVKRNYGNNWYSGQKEKMQILLYREQKGLCNMCQNPFPMKEMQVDHIKRIAEGGKHRKDNMQLICAPCHRQKDGDFMELSGTKSEPTPWRKLPEPESPLI